jgi:Glycosyltransferase family 87
VNSEASSLKAAQSRSSVVSHIVGCLVLAYAAVAILHIALLPEGGFQVNFRVYYYAAKSMAQGLNPYDASVLESSAGSFVLPCAYPPLMVNLYRPLAAFDYVTAYRLHLLVRAVALVFLVWLWHSAFLKRRFDGWFLLVCLIGFNNAIYWDFQAGNITLFEQALLWFGLYQFTRERIGLFTCCVVAASLCKITPMFFLILLPFARPSRKGWAWMIAGMAMFCAFHLINIGMYPDLWAAWRGNIGQVGGMVHPGDGQASTALVHSPATWPFINLLCHKVTTRLGMPTPTALPVVLFGAATAVVLGLSLAAIRKSMKSDSPDAAVHYLIDMACLVYLLMTPRLMVYSYVVGLLPAYRTALRIKPINAMAVLLLLMAIQTIEGRPPGMKLLYESLPAFLPLLIAYAIWVCAVWLKLGRPVEVRECGNDA